MPKGSVSSRVGAIRSHGASVEVTALNYDNTVRLACRMAEENGWYVVQDTALEGIHRGAPVDHARLSDHVFGDGRSVAS
jgi:threonine dehydratase